MNDCTYTRFTRPLGMRIAKIWSIAARLPRGPTAIVSRFSRLPLAGVEGLEPPTPGFGDRCSSQLSYTPSCPFVSTVPGRPKSRGPAPVFSLHPEPQPRQVAPAQTGRRRTSPCYSMMLVTTPAPTVRPPSRIAKRRPSSIAIGAISSTSIAMLSPGITISVPSGSTTDPVTSVVRK